MTLLVEQDWKKEGKEGKDFIIDRHLCQKDWKEEEETRQDSHDIKMEKKTERREENYSGVEQWNRDRN